MSSSWSRMPPPTSSCASILRSPIYAAKQEHEGKTYDAGWEPMRTWENHEKIQRLMDRNNKHKPGGKTQPCNYVRRRAASRVQVGGLVVYVAWGLLYLPRG